MAPLPPAYRRDAAMIHEFANKLMEAGRTNGMIPAARDLATRLRAFLARWQHQTAVGSHEALLATFREQLLRTERRIEALHIATLAELLNVRKCRIETHELIVIIQQLADLIQQASPDQLIEIKRSLGKSDHKDFDPASAIAEQTAKLASQDADYERLIDEYERFWPDRTDDSHYLAILNLEPDQYESLAEELHLLKSALG